MEESKQSHKAPLVQTDINELGDKRLDPKENVAKQREELLTLRHANHAYPGQDLLLKVDRSVGSRLHYSELIRRLQTLNPTILVKDGIPGHVALYRQKTAMEMEHDGYDLARPRWYNEHKYVSGVPKTDIPEWGHLTADTDGIAIREARGWRSVVIAFVKNSVITYRQAVQEFGDPANDQRSKFWFEHLREN
jgi:hypothetical protein